MTINDAFEARMTRIREAGVGCVGVMASDISRDCPRRPVAIVHPPEDIALPPERKCQYHLDVITEFGPRPGRIEVLCSALPSPPPSRPGADLSDPASSPSTNQP